MDRWLVDLKESLWLGLQMIWENITVEAFRKYYIDGGAAAKGGRTIYSKTYLVQRNHLHISGSLQKEIF